MAKNKRMSNKILISKEKEKRRRVKTVEVPINTEFSLQSKKAMEKLFWDKHI